MTQEAGEREQAIGQARRALRDARVKYEAAVRNGYSDSADRFIAYESARLRLADLGRIPCPDCDGAGKVSGSVPGVPASVCTKLSPCERCWPHDEDDKRKFWDDGTAGTITATGDDLGSSKADQ